MLPSQLPVLCRRHLPTAFAWVGLYGELYYTALLGRPTSRATVVPCLAAARRCARRVSFSAACGRGILIRLTRLHALIMHNFMALRMTNTTGVIYAAVGSGLVDDALFSAATHVRDDRRFTRDCSRCMLHDSRTARVA